MKIFNWDSNKSQQFIEARGISFEDVVFYILQGDVLDDLKHPSADKYPNQSILAVSVEEYTYLIPYVETDDEFFLITIIPGREAARKYLGE